MDGMLVANIKDFGRRSRKLCRWSISRMMLLDSFGMHGTLQNGLLALNSVIV